MLRSFFSSLPSLVFCVAVAFSHNLTQALCGVPGGGVAAAVPLPAGAAGAFAAGAAAGGAGALSFFAGGGCWAPAGANSTVIPNITAPASAPAARRWPSVIDGKLDCLISVLTSPCHRRPRPGGLAPPSSSSRLIRVQVAVRCGLRQSRGRCPRLFASAWALPGKKWRASNAWRPAHASPCRAELVLECRCHRRRPGAGPVTPHLTPNDARQDPP